MEVAQAAQAVCRRTVTVRASTATAAATAATEPGSVRRNARSGLDWRPEAHRDNPEPASAAHRSGITDDRRWQRARRCADLPAGDVDGFGELFVLVAPRRSHCRRRLLLHGRRGRRRGRDRLRRYCDKRGTEHDGGLRTIYRAGAVIEWLAGANFGRLLWLRRDGLSRQRWSFQRLANKQCLGHRWYPHGCPT